MHAEEFFKAGVGLRGGNALKNRYFVLWLSNITMFSDKCRLVRVVVKTTLRMKSNAHMFLG